MGYYGRQVILISHPGAADEFQINIVMDPDAAKGRFKVIPSARNAQADLIAQKGYDRRDNSEFLAKTQEEAKRSVNTGRRVQPIPQVIRCEFQLVPRDVKYKFDMMWQRFQEDLTPILVLDGVIPIQELNPRKRSRFGDMLQENILGGDEFYPILQANLLQYFAPPHIGDKDIAKNFFFVKLAMSEERPIVLTGDRDATGAII